jgi:hypothetical protein
VHLKITFGEMEKYKVQTERRFPKIFLLRIP